MERARPVRERFAPGVKRADDRAPAALSPAVPVAAAPASDWAPPPSRRGNRERRALPIAKLAAGLGVVVVVVIVAVVVKSGGGAPVTPKDDVAERQQKSLDEARAFAAKGEHAWAITRCGEAVQLSASTRLGREAAIVCGEQSVLNGDRAQGLEDLQRQIDELPPADPLRVMAEAAVNRLRL